MDSFSLSHQPEKIFPTTSPQHILTLLKNRSTPRLAKPPQIDDLMFSNPRVRPLQTTSDLEDQNRAIAIFRNRFVSKLEKCDPAIPETQTESLNRRGKKSQTLPGSHDIYPKVLVSEASPQQRREKKSNTVPAAAPNAEFSSALTSQESSPMLSSASPMLSVEESITIPEFRLSPVSQQKKRSSLKTLNIDRKEELAIPSKTSLTQRKSPKKVTFADDVSSSQTLLSGRGEKPSLFHEEHIRTTKGSGFYNTNNANNNNNNNNASNSKNPLLRIQDEKRILEQRRLSDPSILVNLPQEEFTAFEARMQRSRRSRQFSEGYKQKEHSDEQQNTEGNNDNEFNPTGFLQLKDSLLFKSALPVLSTSPKTHEPLPQLVSPKRNMLLRTSIEREGSLVQRAKGSGSVSGGLLNLKSPQGLQGSSKCGFNAGVMWRKDYDLSLNARLRHIHQYDSPLASLTDIKDVKQK